jgi:hypothetical protein
MALFWMFALTALGLDLLWFGILGCAGCWLHSSSFERPKALLNWRRQDNSAASSCLACSSSSTSMCTTSAATVSSYRIIGLLLNAADIAKVWHCANTCYCLSQQ